jgi:uncharacterized protein (TIGR03663 family)
MVEEPLPLYQENLDTTQSVSPLVRVLKKNISLTWEQVLVGILFLTALVTRLWNLGARVMSHDESLHVYYSWLLATRSGFQHNPMMHGPFLFEATALMNFLFGASDFTSRLVPAVLGIFIAILIPQLLKPWLGRTGAVATSILLLISPYVLYYSRYIRHDIQVISWTLLAVVAILRYLGSRRNSDLLLLSVALALMFATMEITFIYLAILVLYLLLQGFTRYKLGWRVWRESPEFDVLVVLITLGAFFSSPIALLVLNPIWVRMSGLPFVELKALESQSMAWASGETGIRLLLLWIVFGVSAAGLGIWWSWKRWLKISGVFAAITILLFTTFMTNLSGLGTGFVGSLGYWLSQHEVQRGSQPWYYYLLVFPLYEYLPLVTSMIAGGYFFIKRKTLSPQTRWLVPFLIVWGVGIWVALSIAGEKMPWLSTHIAVPFILLSGWWIGQLLSYGWDLSNATKVLGKAAALGLVTVLTLMTIRTSLLVNYVNYDYTTEFIGYAHGGPGVKDTVRDIDLIGRRTGLGRDLKIAYDDSVSWPMTWYLRDFQNQAFYGSQPNRQALDAPVVIAGPKNWSKVETILIDNYYRYDLIRIWWPIEDYKDLTLERVRYALSDSSMRAALWDIFWSRDYTHYAEITGQRLEPPMEWPLGERMRIYVRMDDVIQTDDFNMKTSRLEDLTKPLDAYSSISKPVLVKNLLYPDLNSPRGMALAPDGSIYIADTGNSRLVKLDSSGNFLKTMGGPTGEDAQSPTPGRFNEPWGVAVDRFGNIYIADTWNHRIQKFDAEGNLLTVWGEPGLPVDGQNHLWGPRGIAVSEDGRVYVTDTGNKRVVVFDSEGAFLFDFGKEGDGLLDEPVGLAFDSQGKIYVADTWKSRIAVFTLEGAFLTSWPVHGWRSISLDNKPYLAVDTQDRIYITDPEGYRVVVFNSTGEALAAYGQYGPEDDSFNLPVGLAVGTDGSLWITDAGSNRLGRYLLWQE